MAIEIDWFGCEGSLWMSRWLIPLISVPKLLATAISQSNSSIYMSKISTKPPFFSSNALNLFRERYILQM